MNEFEISQEFIEENKQNLGQFMPHSHTRGPYTKHQKENRRNEIHRLHFDYGYSSRKIAKLMKINRNTVNSDISYWYSKIILSNKIMKPETAILGILEQLEYQYTRLRERLDKTNSDQEKNAIEHLMLDVNSKIIQTNHKLLESTIRVMDDATEQFNEWLKDSGDKTRYKTIFDLVRVSVKALQKINRIVDDDQKNGVFY